MLKQHRITRQSSLDRPLQAKVGVYAIVENSDHNVALLLRTNTGFSDGQFGLPSGHVDGGETLVEAVRRELSEELGIVVEEEAMILLHVLHRRKINGTERLDFFFRCSLWKGKPRNKERHKHGALIWVSRSDLPDNMIAYHRQGLLESGAGRPLSFWGWDGNDRSSTQAGDRHYQAPHFSK